LPLQKFITSACSISKGHILKDDTSLFQSDEANVSVFLASAYRHFQCTYPKFYKMDNMSKLGWLASEILLKDTFKKGNYQPEKVGLVLANANSSLDDDIKYYESAKDIASPALFVYTLPNIVIGEICIRNNFKGEHTFYIQEDFDAGFIEKQVSYLLDNEILDACICGWVDVLEQEYKAILFLIEKENKGSSVMFSAGNMNDIFKSS
jgi:hypothetical protein